MDIGDVDMGWCRVCGRYAICGMRGMVGTVQMEIGMGGVYAVYRVQTERE